MALGRELVRNLELDARGSTIERWMAHHLAEVIAQADAATGIEKTEADARAADLIQKLWAKRRSLPTSADPLGGYRESIAVLSRLMPDGNPWAAYAARHGLEGLLRNLFDAMARVVVGGILLTQTHASREVSAAETGALEQDERVLLELLAWWEKEVRPSHPAIVRVVIVPSGGSDNTAREEQDTVSTEAVPADDLANLSETEIRYRVRGAVTEDLERLRNDLDTLIQRWRKETEKEGDISRELE